MNKKAKISPLAKQVRENSIGWMLKRLGSQLDLEMAHELKQRGLNLNQFTVLMTLMEEEGQTQTQIGKKIKMQILHFRKASCVIHHHPKA